MNYYEKQLNKKLECLKNNINKEKVRYGEKEDDKIKHTNLITLDNLIQKYSLSTEEFSEVMHLVLIDIYHGNKHVDYGELIYFIHKYIKLIKYNSKEK